MLIRTAEPVRYVERMLAARAQRRRQRRNTEIRVESTVPAVELQVTNLPPVVEHLIRSWGGPVPETHVRRIRAGYAPASGAA